MSGTSIIAQFSMPLSTSNKPIVFTDGRFGLLAWKINGNTAAEINSQVLIDTNFQRKIVNIFLAITLSICFGCSKQMSH